MDDLYYLNLALEEAKLALKEDEVPVGAVLVMDDKVIASCHNTKQKDQLIISHAEINCLIEASKKLHNYCLDKCVLYVTLEPCQMCASALQQAKIKRIVFGAKDYKNGACGGLYDFFFIPKMNYYPLISYLENDECLQIIKEYFIKKRKK